MKASVKKKASSPEIVIDPRTKSRAGKTFKARKQELADDIVPLEQEARKELQKPVRNAEAVFKNEYRRMLMYNSKLIKRMNIQLETALSSRDIYALSTLMSQQREVINDLRAISDLSGQVGMIYDQAVNPFISDLTQIITDVYYQLRKLLMEVSKSNETAFALEKLDELTKHLGIGLQTSHSTLRQTIEVVMIGNPESKTPKTKRKRA